MARLDRQAWSPHMAIAWEEGDSEQDFPRYRAPLAERGAIRRRGQAKVGACKVVKGKVDDAAVEPFVAASDLGGAQPTRREPVVLTVPQRGGRWLTWRRSSPVRQPSPNYTMLRDPGPTALVGLGGTGRPWRAHDLPSST